MPGFPVLHCLPEFAQTRVIESVMPSNHLLCHPLLLLPSIFPSIRVFPVSWLFASSSQSIGASASALWVAYAYEVRIQEKCWGLSSSFFQVSWGCRKSSVEQGRQELWLWFEFGTAWLGVLRFSTQALDQLIPEAF